MAVKIYDKESKAFKDAETPLVHDGNLRAWKESTGLVWNDGAQAWEGRWAPAGYLFNRGWHDEAKVKLVTILAATLNPHGYQNHFCGISTVEKIDLTRHERLEIIASFEESQNLNVVVTSRNDAHYTDDVKKSELFTVAAANGEYVLDLSEINGACHVMAGVGVSSNSVRSKEAFYEGDHVRCHMVNVGISLTTNIYEIRLIEKR